MEIHVMPTGAIAEFVVDRLADAVQRSVMAGRRPSIGLTTGTTPLATGIYAEMVRRVQAGQLDDLCRAVFFNPDEFLNLPDDHPESYHVYQQKHLLQHLDAALARQSAAAGETAADRSSRVSGYDWYIPSGADAAYGAAQAECERMERAVVAAGGIDFQLLGIGINGHVCFIEPAEALPSTCFVTPIAEVNRQLYAADFGGSLAAVPTHAITFGVGTLLRARELCLVAVGARKADIVRRALCDPVCTTLPASLLQLHAHVRVVLDDAAAAALPLATLEQQRPGLRIVRHGVGSA